MYTLVIIAALALVVYLFMQQPLFGRIPSGERLQRIEQSPNFKDGNFQNLSPTPQLAEGHSFYSVLKKFLFEKKERSKPIDSLPSQKTNLLALNPNENVLVWFGHSSYFMQIDGKKILVDPVLSGAASPIKMTTRSYVGSDVYTPEDFPEIDYLFISHDLSVIEHVCNRIAVMYLGKIVEIADRDELFNNPKHPYTQALIGAIPRVGQGKKKMKKSLAGEVPSPINPPSGCHFHTRCPYVMEICSQKTPLLEGPGEHKKACFLNN